jgi:hypothetical protein
MISLYCRIFVLLLMALPCTPGTRGALARHGSETGPTHQSETEEIASNVEAITSGSLTWTWVASPRQVREAFQVRPVFSLPGHRLANGLNAPLLA